MTKESRQRLVCIFISLAALAIYAVVNPKARYILGIDLLLALAAIPVGLFAQFVYGKLTGKERVTFGTSLFWVLLALGIVAIAYTAVVSSPIIGRP